MISPSDTQSSYIEHLYGVRVYDKNGFLFCGNIMYQYT